MDRLIKIRDWDDHFEVAQSRKIDGPLTWVAMPTKHDGKGYRRIMAHANGPAIYAVWCVLVQIAGKQPSRGTLADADGPLTTFDIHLKSALPETLIDEAVNYLSSKDIGWLVVVDWERTGSGVALQDRTVQDRTEQHTTEQASVVVNESAPDLEPLSPAWLDIASLLRSEGMDLATQVCESARGNNCTPYEIQTMLAHWIENKPAWPIGTLHNKIKSLRPGQKVIWPEKSAEHKARVADAASQEKTRKQMEVRKKVENGRRSAATERADLESKFGDALDAMSKQNVHDFLLLRLPKLANTAVDLPIPKGLLRDALLYELSKEHSDPSPIPQEASC